jgi:hypothetical protein
LRIDFPKHDRLRARALAPCVAALGALLLAAACDASESEPEPTRGSSSRDTDAAAPAAPVRGDPLRPSFCARKGDDAVREVFCADSPPTIQSLHDLQVALDVDPSQLGATGRASAAAAANSYAAVSYLVALGHSTALRGHLVSPINPRAIVLGRETILAFQRGVQSIELASRVRDQGSGRAFNFYLVSFEQACSTSARGCSPGDLYTPRIESDWTSLAVRDDEDLANSPEDCRQCHQRGRASPTLLMRELENPWTHFFEPDTEPAFSQLPGVLGRDLVRDYLAAKGDEAYGGIAPEVFRHTVGLTLETLVGRGQPLVFDSPRIVYERWSRGSAGWSSEPTESPTWEAGYEAFKRGEQLPMPYFEPRPTDPDKQAKLSAAYRRYREGELDADELPDLADIFPDDPLLRARIGLQTEPGASAPEALIQACASCHNDVLDQNISRARFNVDLSRLARAELAVAIDRLERASHEPGVMPPPEGRQLDPETRLRLIDYLRESMHERAIDPALEHAARLGMAGGAR